MSTRTRPFVAGLISHKGGGGRTTAAFTVAETLMLQGKNVLIVDMDVEAPGVALFSRMNEPEGGTRIALCPVVPECLREVHEGGGAFLSENILTEKNYGKTGKARQVVRFPGLLDWLAHTLEELGLQVADGANTESIRKSIIDFLRGFVNTDNLKDVSDSLERVVGDYIYELWPGENRMPARGFVMPVGGHFHRHPATGGKEAGSWRYAANNRPLSNRGSQFAIPLAVREFLLAGVNVNSALLRGVVRLFSDMGMGLDYIIIDYRPGDSYLTETASLAADGATYVSVATTGAMASFYDNLREHENLFKLAGAQKVPAITGNLYCKLASERGAKWTYAPIEEGAFKGDSFADFSGLKSEYLDAALQIA